MTLTRPPRLHPPTAGRAVTGPTLADYNVDIEPGDDPLNALRRLAHSLRDLFRRHRAAAPLIMRCSSLQRTELELFRAYLDALSDGGLAAPAAILRPLVAFALGSGYTESSMLSVWCEPAAPQARSERELLLALGQALPAGTPPELASAAVAVIADCNPDLCFEDGLELMLAGARAAGS